MLKSPRICTRRRTHLWPSTGVCGANPVTRPSSLCTRLPACHSTDRSRMRARTLALLHQQLRCSSTGASLAAVQQQARGWASAAAGPNDICITSPPVLPEPAQASAPALPAPEHSSSAAAALPAPHASAKEQPALPHPEDSGEELRVQVLSAAMHHVKSLGWTQAALVAGARDLGLSPAVAGIVHHGESALVEHFVATSNAAAIKALEGMQPELAAMRLPQRIHTAVRLRLEQNIPQMESWPQALAVLARPGNSGRGLRLLYELVDGIWYAVGDKSTDSSWFTKRALLAGIYTTTELYMLTDYTPGYQDTWEALERRINDALWAGKAARQAGSAVQSLLSNVANLFGGLAPQYQAQQQAGPSQHAAVSASTTLDTAGGSITFGTKPPSDIAQPPAEGENNLTWTTVGGQALVTAGAHG